MSSRRPARVSWGDHAPRLPKAPASRRTPSPRLAQRGHGACLRSILQFKAKEEALLEKLTIDTAVAEFHKLLRAELDSRAAARSERGTAEAPETGPEDAEALRSCLAENLVRLACGDAARCSDHRCRRRGACRHLASFSAQQRQGSRRPQHARRGASAEALRRAIQVWMTARASGDDTRRGRGGASGSRPNSARVMPRA